MTTTWHFTVSCGCLIFCCQWGQRSLYRTASWSTVMIRSDCLHILSFIMKWKPAQQSLWRSHIQLRFIWDASVIFLPTLRGNTNHHGGQIKLYNTNSTRRSQPYRNFWYKHKDWKKGKNTEQERICICCQVLSSCVRITEANRLCFLFGVKIAVFNFLSIE